jgi:hypothetical protein
VPFGQEVPSELDTVGVHAKPVICPAARTRPSPTMRANFCRDALSALIRRTPRPASHAYDSVIRGK